MISSILLFMKITLMGLVVFKQVKHELGRQGKHVKE